VKVANTGQALEEEFEFKGSDNKSHWLHHQVIAINDGIAITTRNITKRKQAEMETWNSRAFLQSLIDYLPVLIYAKSMRPENFGQMVIWQKAAEVITGYAASQMTGKT